ncbi:MAG: imelysin family protein, partial [Bacteroidota bacterium]
DFAVNSMVANIADNLIIPGYEDLQQKVDVMAEDVNAFSADINQNNLDALRASWLDAYLSFQNVAQYEFGPAEDAFLRNSVNNFPINAGNVDDNIASGSYNFNSPDAFDKGFPALDYLLYGIGADDQAILTQFADSAYSRYLQDVTADIKFRVDSVTFKWTDSYRESFVRASGTAAGTALSLLVNNLNQHFEIIKRDKIGIPVGVVTLGFTNPEKVEAFYSGKSLELAVASLEASEDLYLGGNGSGFDDFLTEIEAAKDGESLDKLIQDQFASGIETLKALQGPLSEAVNADKAAVENAYNEVVKNLVNLKTDMPSVLCVTITYVDNPSDSD